MSRRYKKLNADDWIGEIISTKSLERGVKIQLVDDVFLAFINTKVPKGTVVTLINNRGEFEVRGERYYAKRGIVLK